MSGSACGRRILTNRRQAPAPVERARSITSGSSDLKPAMLLTTIGKKLRRNTSRSLGRKPKPNQMMKSGAIAILGTICRNTING